MGKRITLTLCGTSERDCDPSMGELALFYFDGSFVMSPIDIGRGDTIHHCTKIHMMGQTFVVTEHIEDIQQEIFGDYIYVG